MLPEHKAMLLPELEGLGYQRGLLVRLTMEGHSQGGKQFLQNQPITSLRALPACPLLLTFPNFRREAEGQGDSQCKERQAALKTTQIPLLIYEVWSRRGAWDRTETLWHICGWRICGGWA